MASILEPVVFDPAIFRQELNDFDLRITFDELYAALKEKCAFYAAAAEVEKSVAAPGLSPL